MDYMFTGYIAISFIYLVMGFYSRKYTVKICQKDLKHDLEDILRDMIILKERNK